MFLILRHIVNSTSILFCSTTSGFYTVDWLFMFQVFQEQMAKHQILSRSSSEPSQPTFQSTHTPDHTVAVDRYHIEENTQEHDQMNTDMQANDDAEIGSKEVTQDKPVGRDTVIKDKTLITHGQVHVENDTNVSLEDKECDKTKDTNMEPMERDGKSTDTLRWAMHTVCV